MFKKLSIGLAPPIAIAAFAVIPVAAQATGHYYSNGIKMAEGSKKTVIEWGSITWAGVKGGTLPNHITCHNAAGGTIENPTGGGAGVGATEVFVAYQCESENVCPTPLVAKATAENIANGVGWPNVLSEPEAERWRIESSKVKVLTGCYNPVELEAREGGGERYVEIGGYGTENPAALLHPESHKGTGALHPGGVVFGPATGDLAGEVRGEELEIKPEGEVKTLGYTSQELINVKQ